MSKIKTIACAMFIIGWTSIGISNDGFKGAMYNFGFSTVGVAIGILWSRSKK